MCPTKMSDPFAILTAAVVETAEFASFLEEVGGTADPDQLGTGRISQGRRHVWVFLSSQTLAEVLEQFGDALTQALGARPQSCVVLEMSSAPDSEALAIEFAIRFAERWPAVLFDLESQVLNLATSSCFSSKVKV